MYKNKQISPSLADLILEILGDDAIKKLPWKLPFYFRYAKKQTLKAFNDFDEDEHLQFTMELEKQN